MMKLISLRSSKLIVIITTIDDMYAFNCKQNNLSETHLIAPLLIPWHRLPTTSPANALPLPTPSPPLFLENIGKCIRQKPSWARQLQRRDSGCAACAFAKVPWAFFEAGIIVIDGAGTTAFTFVEFVITSMSSCWRTMRIHGRG